MIVLLQTSWSELQTGVIAKPVLDHLASNWNVWWNRSWLVASVSFALQEKKEESSACGRANKIKESSCGVSLANNEDRQKTEIQRGFTTKTWGKKHAFWHGSAQRKPCWWGHLLTSFSSTACLPLSHLWNTSFLSANTPPSAWNSEAWHHHPEAALAE